MSRRGKKTTEKELLHVLSMWHIRLSQTDIKLMVHYISVQKNVLQLVQQDVQ